MEREESDDLKQLHRNDHRRFSRSPLINDDAQGSAGD